MDPLKVFSARDLRLRSGELLQEAEDGRLSILTKRGRPAILAVPFDERLLRYGVHRAVALDLFEQGQVGLAQGARIAGVSAEDFVALLGEAGVDAVKYSPGDLEQELQTAL